MKLRSAATHSHLALVIAFSAVLAGCQQQDQPRGAAPAAEAAGPANTEALEGQVSIVAAPGYIERGATDRNFDWVTPFEADTGCKVKVKTAGTADEMVALLAQGGQDLVIASGDASLRLIRDGSVQPLDLERVPSFVNVDARLQNAAWHFVDGRHYGTPWQWGTNLLLYNTKAFTAPPASWAVVFEERKLADGRSNKGRVQAYDGPIYLADAALYLMATRPELGIKDPYELNEDQYAAVLELLRQQRPLVQRYWRDVNVAVQDFTAGSAVASGSRQFVVSTLVANRQPVAGVLPVEGATGWADTTLLAAQAKHPNCAYKWLEWSLNAKVQGDVAAWSGSVPAVPAACDDNLLLGDEGCAANGFDDFGKLHFWRMPQEKCGTGTCVPYSRWAKDYAAIRAGG